MRKILLFTSLVLTATVSRAQFLVVDNTTLTPQQLVENVLVGSGVTVSNVVWNGSIPLSSVVQPQAGQFDGTTSNIGLPNGILLGSGNVQVAVGPNTAGGASLGGGSGSSAVDPDLQAITPNPIYHQAVLEFDFVPQGDTLSFRFVFASEEYDEYVCGSVNDAFGFFLSGPGISGPYTGGAANIALIPGTSTPVSINTVNLGVPGSTTGGSPTNCAAIDPAWASYNVFYTQNLLNSVQYDGFTVPITAMSPVQCGQTYHIKLAIGDAGDGAWDSGVFIEGGSFSSNAVEVTITTPTSAGFVDGAVYENCILGTDATFYLVRPNPGDADTIPFSFSGSATLGADYTSSTLDTFAIFAPGEDSASFGVSILNDGVPEGLDSLIVTVYNINPCGDTIITSGTLYINDPLIIVPVIANDTIPCIGQPVSFNGTVTGSPLDMTYSWTGPGGIPDTDVTVGYTPPSAGAVTFTATDECGFTGTGTAFIVVVPVPVNANGGPDHIVPCPGNVVSLAGSGSGGTGAYTYGWSGPSLSSSLATVNYSVPSTTPVYFTVTDVCGQTDTDTVQVTVDPIPVFANAGPDQSVICPGTVINLNGSASGGTGTIEYLWLYSGGTIATTPSTTHTPAATQMVFLTVTDDCGQTDIDTMTVTVPVLAPYNLTYTPTANVTCPGDQVTLNMLVNSGGTGGPYTYLWENADADNSTNVNVTSSPMNFEIVITDNCGVDTTVNYTLTITVFDPLEITSLSGELCEGLDATIFIPVTIEGGAGDNVVSWMGPIGATIQHDYDNSQGVVLNPLTGTYYVTVTDQCGNTAIDTSAITVFPCEIIIPNIVTPNGDGTNDVIHIENLEYHPNTAFVIFNRWGQVKYETSNYQNDYNPTELTDGVYFYVLKLTDGSTPSDYNGTIQVNKKK